jgi:hypothetical protein
LRLWGGLRHDVAGLGAVVDILAPLLLNSDAAVRAGARSEAADESLWADLSEAGRSALRTAMSPAIAPAGVGVGPDDYDAQEPDFLVVSLLPVGAMYQSQFFVDRAMILGRSESEQWGEMARHLPASKVPVVLGWAEERDRRALADVLEAVAERPDIPVSADQMVRWALSPEARVRLAVQSLAARVPVAPVEPGRAR